MRPTPSSGSAAASPGRSIGPRARAWRKKAVPWPRSGPGPVYGRDRPEDDLLASCYAEALRLAEEREMVSVAFPAISTGAFGYPMEDAARVALETVAARAPSLRSVRRVRFVLYDDEARLVHARILADLATERR